MNERIKLLAEQANVEVMKNTPSFLVTNEMWKEKFAELIVRECARVDSEANNVDHVDGESYNYTILQHFGIKK